MRKILELAQSKGEEASAYFIHILHQAYDAFIDLRPWFNAIHYKPVKCVKDIPVINTDPSECFNQNHIKMISHPKLTALTLNSVFKLADTVRNSGRNLAETLSSSPHTLRRRRRDWKTFTQIHRWKS